MSKLASIEETAVSRLNAEIMDKLAELGGKAVGEDEILYGDHFMIPELYRDNLGQAIDFLVKFRDQMEEPHRFAKVFPFKPWDGAVAVTRAFKKYFGAAAVQRSGFFEQAGYEMIPVGVNEEVRAPFGKMTIPTFRGTLRIQDTKDEEEYSTFFLVVDSPKKYQYHVEGLFKLVEKELKENSIYKGKAIDGSDKPKFIDLSRIDISKIIYSENTLKMLQANLWNPIMYPEICKAEGIDSKRAVLLEGPYGTGKTLAAMWTAKICEQMGRTFIMCNPKENNAFECLKTAALYPPACVFVEDIDKLAETSNRDNMSRLLDEFDGFKAKDKDITIVLTTNRVGQIHKGMLRPGRMDAVIQIGNLDRPGVEKLIKGHFKHEQLKDLDYEAIHEAMDQFSPSFMKEVCQKVVLYSVSRISEGMPVHYTTQDFMLAADEMRDHYNLHSGANELLMIPDTEKALMKMVENAMNGVRIVDRSDDDPMYRLDTQHKDVKPKR